MNPRRKTLSRKLLQAQLKGARPRTRFAPSPTGYLHLGHVVNALYVWGIARACEGEVILRLEDHDRTRFRPEYENALLEDLEQLGFLPDIGPIQDFRSGPTPYRQSDREERYRNLAATLEQEGLLYSCDCSRKSLRQRLAASGKSITGEIAYDGYCRDRGLPLDDHHAWRLILPDKAVYFQDLALGPNSPAARQPAEKKPQGNQVQYPAQETGDVVIRDRHRCWSYQFAVVADDLDQDVNLIIRGLDILGSTGRQQLIARASGRELKALYFHHDLLMGADGAKLSKKHFSADIHVRLQAGEPKEEILGEAAYLAGLIPMQRPVSQEEIPDLVVTD